MKRTEVISHGHVQTMSQGNASSYRFEQTNSLSPVIMMLSLGEDAAALGLPLQISDFKKAKITVQIEVEEDASDSHVTID